MRACSVAVAVLVFASNGWAQQPPTSENAKPPIRVERVENRFVVSPDYKMTRLDADTGQLAGVSAGYLMQEIVYVGGSAYWLAGGAPGWDLSYGGFVLGIRVPGSHRIAFGAKGLTGFGHATLGTTFGEFMPAHDWPPAAVPVARGGHWHVPGMLRGSPNVANTPLEVSESFFVFEPQADFVVSITKRIRFSVSGGYRATAGVDALHDRVNGATATLSVEFVLPK